NCIHQLKDNHAITTETPVENKVDQETFTSDFDLFTQIEDYIKHHINDDVSLHKVAEHFFYNSSYLSRLFKAKLNINYVDFVNDIKIKLAQHYLQKSQLSVAEVSMKSGFNSYKYFAKTFRNHTNMTPTEYRKQLRS